MNYAFVVINGRVAVNVPADYPGAWHYYGAWYVWEGDYRKAVEV